MEVFMRAVVFATLLLSFFTLSHNALACHSECFYRDFGDDRYYRHHHYEGYNTYPYDFYYRDYDYSNGYFFLDDPNFYPYYTDDRNFSDDFSAMSLQFHF
jgi:hypothetical protein